MDALEIALEDWLDDFYSFFLDFSSKRWIRMGTEYALDGRVRHVGILPDGTIEGRVQEARGQICHVIILDPEEVDFGAFTGQCSCPVDYNCKHTYAVALRLLAEIHHGAPHLVPWAFEFLPAAWHKKQAAMATAQFSGCKPWATAGEVEADPVPWWRRFLAASRRDEAINHLIRGLEHRFPRAPAIVRQLFARNMMGSSANKMTLLQRFEDYTANLSVREGWELAPDKSGLVEWLATEEFQDLIRDESRAAALQAMAHWLQQRTPKTGAATGHIEVVWHVVPPGGNAPFPLLHFQVLLSTKRLRRDARHGQALESLIREVEQGHRSLPDAQAAIMVWIGRQHAYHTSRQADSFSVENAMLWLTNWAHRGVITWRDTGEPVRFDPGPAKLTLAREGDRVFWAAHTGGGGAPLPLNQVTLVSEGGQNGIFRQAQPLSVFLLHEGTLRRLETGGIPMQLLHHAHLNPELPLSEIKAQGLGDGLLEHLRLLGGLDEAPLVEEVMVSPRVEFYLTAKHRLQVRALAEGPDSRCFERMAAGQWVPVRAAGGHDNDDEFHEEDGSDDAIALPVEEAPEAVSDVDPIKENPLAIAVRPRMADLAPVEAWLCAVIPAAASHDTLPSGLSCFGWPLLGKATADFLEVWEQRPAGLRCYGNSRMRDLVTLRTPPQFRINIEESGVQWLTVSVEMQAELDALSYREVEEALRAQDTPSILLPQHGRFRRADLEMYQDQVRALAGVGLDLQPGRQRIHALQLGAASEELLGDSPGMKRLAEQGQALRKTFTGIPKAKLPKDIAHHLRHYQQTGADFCTWACQTFGGAILADDMGLGKTLQVLATITALRKKKAGKKPALVVCPASVTHNWQREAARFTPKLRTLVLERGAERIQLLKTAGQYDLVIKNYALARRDIDLLKEQSWGLVCVDEAQAIKNPDAVITQALKSLDAEYRIALTGTPIENRLTDLWSIVDFAVPGYLPRRQEYEGSVGNQPGELEYHRLRARLRPILLRRLKAEVAPELPPRIEERLDCAMTPAQRRAYLTELKHAQEILSTSKTQKKVAGQARIQILAALTRLRQLCCDPALRGLPQAGSGKVEVFIECMQRLIEGGHKVLVFSQFVKMLDIIAVKLKACGIPHYTLTGQTRHRPELVARFEADPNPAAFLISLKAGGTGLNLVSASYVILFDPWWNPAAEAQAIDRTHRIGQDKTVVAYRLVTEDSIEERIVELQEKKRELIANVLEADAFNRSLTKDDFEFILQ
jgi:superfamily II DNA or RNA helicase